MLLGVQAIFSSALVRDSAPWTTRLVEATDILGDGLISLSFLAGWAEWRWRDVLDKRVPAVAQRAIVVGTAVTLAGLQIARGRNEELQREVVVRKRAEEESRQLALIDPLSNIYNRRGFTALAAHVREIARRQRRPIHVLLIDLDRFKRINDAFGHAVGDKALVEFAQILTATFRKSDVVARTGGDEFCVLLAEPADGIQTAMARLRQNVDDSNGAGTRSYRLEFSIGVARAMPNDDDSIHALVEMADEAMYEEKRLREGAA